VQVLYTGTWQLVCIKLFRSQNPSESALYLGNNVSQKKTFILQSLMQKVWVFGAYVAAFTTVAHAYIFLADGTLPACAVSWCPRTSLFRY
jgi:hypothetical protein